MNEWSTDISGITDADGAFAFRGFHGDYMLTLRDGSQQQVRKEFRLAPGKEALVVPVTARRP